MGEEGDGGVIEEEGRGDKGCNWRGVEGMGV